MLAFVTSLRHPLNSHDYRRVESLLDESLSSWLNQLSHDLVVVVVGNRQPPLPTDPRIHFVGVGFEPPTGEASARTSLAAVLRDKGTKLAVGLARARELGASHIMFVDADDFVSRRIAGFVANHVSDPGWTIVDGWRVNIERRAVRAHRGDFDRNCGSSHIVRADLYPNPGLPIDATQRQLYDGYGDKLERWIGSHMNIRQELGLPALPFPGALYRVSSGESHSGNSLGGFGRPISRRLADEFAVPSASRSPLAIARAVLPSSRALIERLPRRQR